MVARKRVASARNARSRATLLLFVPLFAACAAPAPVASCLAGEERSVLETVYFGANIPGGGEVSADQWRDFRDAVIAPRFPQGLTSFKGEGQWRNNAGAIESENTYILQIVHPDSPATGAAIGEVATIYKTRFKQEAVLRVRSASCISLNRASG
jgi:hypothetical protein